MRNRASSSAPESDPASPARGIFYGWWLVGIAAFMLTLMSLTVFQGLGTLLVVLERRFGWSRFALSVAFSLARVEGAVLGPIEGILVDRIGSRRMALFGYLIMGVGFLLLAGVNSLWQFYVAFIVITLGSGLGGWLAMVAMVNNWFRRRRSFAMAAAMSGVHFGGFLVPVFAIVLEAYGFKTTSLGIGIFLLLIIGPVASAIRNHPEDYGMRPDGDPPPGSEARSPGAGAASVSLGVDEEAHFSVRQALKTSAFWLLTLAQVASSIAIVTLSLHLSPKLVDMGMSLPRAGMVQTGYTVVALGTQFVSGYFADRLPKPPLIALLLTLQAIAILVLALAETPDLVWLFALLYGIGFGGRTPLTTAIRGEYFGRRSFGRIMGISQLPMNIGMMFAPPFAGHMFDTTGSYRVPFTVFAALSFIGAILMLFVKKPRMPAPQRGADSGSRRAIPIRE